MATFEKQKHDYDNLVKLVQKAAKKAGAEPNIEVETAVFHLVREHKLSTKDATKVDRVLTMSYDISAEWAAHYTTTKMVDEYVKEYKEATQIIQRLV